MKTVSPPLAAFCFLGVQHIYRIFKEKIWDRNRVEQRETCSVAFSLV